MAFTVLFLAHAPDAESEKHRCLIETSKYKLFIRVVKDQHQAVGVCKSLDREEGIHSILLCPGFTHENVAEIAEVVGRNVGVFVARGDGPSSRITLDTYSHVLPGLQEAAAQRFDDFLSPRAVETEDVSKMLANQFETDIGVAGFEPATT